VALNNRAKKESREFAELDLLLFALATFETYLNVQHPKVNDDNEWRKFAARMRAK
jgi:hypothetical protein